MVRLVISVASLFVFLLVAGRFEPAHSLEVLSTFISWLNDTTPVRTFQCPSNSKPLGGKPSIVSFDDCECLDGFRKDLSRRGCTTDSAPAQNPISILNASVKTHRSTQVLGFSDCGASVRGQCILLSSNGVSCDSIQPRSSNCQETAIYTMQVCNTAPIPMRLNTVSFDFNDVASAVSANFPVNPLPSEACVQIDLRRVFNACLNSRQNLETVVSGSMPNGGACRSTETTTFGRAAAQIAWPAPRPAPVINWSAGPPGAEPTVAAGAPRTDCVADVRASCRLQSTGADCQSIPPRNSQCDESALISVAICNDGSVPMTVSAASLSLNGSSQSILSNLSRNPIPASQCVEIDAVFGFNACQTGNHELVVSVSGSSTQNQASSCQDTERVAFNTVVASAPAPTPVPPTAIGQTQVIPSQCEVRELVNLMDQAVRTNKALAPQWLRLAFHDAGTFDQRRGVGGANGCLLTDNRMRFEMENDNLDLALEPLGLIQGTWNGRASAADLIQFAGFFAVVRQKGRPGLNAQKRLELERDFEWGRVDETACNPSWTENLPGFQFDLDDVTNIPRRCLFAGAEIKNKMMDRNGFTAFEATALIGAHTIGLTRHVFTEELAGPWARNGGDEATIEGAVFDNGFHSFLIDDIQASSAQEFGNNRAPFDRDFATWYQFQAANINHMDTDVVLAFPSQNANIHPDYHTFTERFARDNNFFISSFMQAYHKMSKLGNRQILARSVPCEQQPANTPAFSNRVFGSGFEFQLQLQTALAEATVLLQNTAVARREQTEFLTSPIN